MIVMFTQHALESLRERDFDLKAFHALFDLLNVVEGASDIPSVLGEFAEVVRVKHGERQAAFIVQVGDMRAVLTVDPAKPEQVIVMSAYRADQGQTEAGQSSVKTEEAVTG